MCRISKILPFPLQAMWTVVKDPVKMQSFGAAGRTRVISQFSFAAFARLLNDGVESLVGSNVADAESAQHHKDN